MENSSTYIVVCIARKICGMQLDMLVPSFNSNASMPENVNMGRQIVPCGIKFA